MRVVIQSQRWERPLADERRALGLRPGALARVRPVHLICRGRPCVYARSVIPAATLRGPARRLARLGTRPLGAFLFADRRTTRDAVEGAALAPGSVLHDCAAACGGPIDTPVWGRRSVFRMRGRPLLVMEVFLPGLLP
jgi:chorismate--pyruvate lyase